MAGDGGSWEGGQRGMGEDSGGWRDVAGDGGRWRGMLGDGGRWQELTIKSGGPWRHVWEFGGAAGGGRRTLFWLRKKPLGSAISPGEKALTVTVFS
jgi:hypothetical protein